MEITSKNMNAYMYCAPCTTTLHSIKIFQALLLKKHAIFPYDINLNANTSFAVKPLFLKCSSFNSIFLLRKKNW